MFDHWSMTGPDGTEERKAFEKFSEKFQRLYPTGYMLDKSQHIVASPQTPTINLAQLTGLFISSDENLWERSKWMFDGHFRFLDGQPIKSNKIAFCSFPRSGNTFLRKYLEMLTGIATGADLSLHVNMIL